MQSSDAKPKYVMPINKLIVFGMDDGWCARDLRLVKLDNERLAMCLSPIALLLAVGRGLGLGSGAITHQVDTIRVALKINYFFEKF